MEKDLQSTKEISLALMRHLLGSLDLADLLKIEQERMTDEEAANLAADAELFWRKSGFDKQLNLFILETLRFGMEQTADETQLAVSRGTLNGLILIKEWFEQKTTESLGRFQKKEEPPVDEISMSL